MSVHWSMTDMFSLLTTNVDGARVDGTWMTKPDFKELEYCIGGMYERETEHEIIEALLSDGQHDVRDSACTSYELTENQYES